VRTSSFMIVPSIAERGAQYQRPAGNSPHRRTRTKVLSGAPAHRRHPGRHRAGGVVIQRVENYLMDCVTSGSRVLRTVALLALTVAGLLALAVGALTGFMLIAALFMLAAWIGTESLTLLALVLVLFMLVLLFMYPFWRWWRRRRRTASNHLW
jgi:hypothetical protein